MSEESPYERSTLEPDCELTWVRASGPGGQHRNKAETGVRLKHGPSGIVISATERRSRQANIAVAFKRLAERLRERDYKPPPRRPTKPTRASVQRRLDTKRQKGEAKRRRRSPKEES